MTEFETKITRRSLLGTSVGSVAALAAGAEPVAASRTQSGVEAVPEVPYLVPAHGAPLFRGRSNYGWQALDITDRIRLVHGLHPDFADFRRLIWIESPDDGLPPGAANQAAFSTREGVAGTSGQTIYVNADAEEAERAWGWVREHNDWTFPDGTSVDNPTELFAERFDGTAQGYGVQNNGIGIPSVFAPGTLDILLMGARKAFEVGFSGMFLDSTTSPRLQGIDFSPWAQAAFRGHLATLSDDRLDDLGVTDADSLDVRQALEDRGVTPFEDGDIHPATDPLYREYLLFQHRGLQALVTAYKSRIDSEFPDRDPRTTLLYGNQYLGDTFSNAPATGIHLSEVLDIVNIEDNRTLPPDVVREPAYKLMYAAAKGEKPVLFEGQMHDQPGSAETLRGLDPTKRYHTLQRLQLAEAYANAVPRKLPLTSWGNIEADATVTHWVRKDGTIPDELQSFADFLWTNERFLRSATPDNDVAVVCSLPTLLWENAPQWDRAPDRHLDSFRGVCALLRDARIPYDVTVFGHERLYDDAPHLDSLAEYDAVVLPGITSIADRHVEALRSVIETDGTVLTSATIPGRDSSYEPRSTAWLEGNAVTNLTDDPGLARAREDRTTGGLAAALDGVADVTIEGAADVGVNRLRTENPETAQIHLLNYAYDAETDTVETAREVTLTVAENAVGFDPAAAAYITPRGRLNVETQRDGDSITLSLPRLDEWGFVVFVDDTEVLSPPGDEDEARTTVSSLADTVARASEELSSPSTNLDLTRSRVFLQEARVALDDGVYDKAEARADAGLVAAEKLPMPDTPTKSPNTPTVSAQSESSPSGSATEPPADPTSPTETTAPGMGITTALAGASLAAWRLVRDRDGDN